MPTTADEGGWTMPRRLSAVLRVSGDSTRYGGDERGLSSNIATRNRRYA